MSKERASEGVYLFVFSSSSCFSYALVTLVYSSLFVLYIFLYFIFVYCAMGVLSMSSFVYRYDNLSWRMIKILTASRQWGLRKIKILKITMLFKIYFKSRSVTISQSETIKYACYFTNSTYGFGSCNFTYSLFNYVIIITA